MSMPTDEEIEEEFEFHIGDKVILDGCGEWAVIDHHRRFSFEDTYVQYLYTLRADIGLYESLIVRDVNEDRLELA